MGWLPWSSSSKSGDSEPGPEPTFAGAPNAEPLVACGFQDGQLFVYEDGLYIDRPSRSNFEGKWILMSQVTAVTVDNKLTVHYLHIRQQDVPNNEGGLFSTPVGENTVHLGRGKRDCADRAKALILERANEFDQE